MTELSSGLSSMETNYFILECYRDEDSADPTLPDLRPPLDNWLGGERLDVEVPQPLIFEIKSGDEGELLPLYTRAILLMSDDLVQALREAGVDNIDCYDAIVREESTGIEHTDYKAVNIVGVVRAANLTKSDATELGLADDGLINVFFASLVLDEENTRGALLFRLAENVSYIIVHRKVRDHLLASGFERLSFEVPEEEEDLDEEDENLEENEENLVDPDLDLLEDNEC
jgi:hypothetical protein